MDFELGIIGAGTGGYVAAIRAAQNGKKVVLIEKENLGGVCLNRGCIPTKTLLKSSEKWQDLSRAEEFGLSLEHASFDWGKIQERKRNVIAQMQGGIKQLLKANKVTVLYGEASLIDAHRLQIRTSSPAGPEDEAPVSRISAASPATAAEISAAEASVTTLTCENLILATGSSPARPPIPGSDLPGVITSDELLELDQVPESLVIVGAGVIGLEFACVFAPLGCKITLVEMLPSILPPGDVDLQRRLGLALRKQNITAKTKAAVQSITTQNGQLEVKISAGGKEEILPAAKVLIATGRRPNLNPAELDKLQIAYTKKGILVNEKMQTSAAGVYAIGDVTGLSMLAHSAAHQGLVAVANICGQSEIMDYHAIPSCVFTHPEIASVGLTEQECKERGLNPAISKFNFAANGKAVTMGETEGLVKLLADKETHRLLGCHIIGPHASDLIMEGALAVQQGLTAEALTGTIHPHPTLSEAVSEVALGLFGNMLHQVNLRR